MLAIAQPTLAQTIRVRIDLPKEALARALDDVARIGGISVLFDKARLKENRSPAVHGVYNADQALALLLRGTGLVAKQIAVGSYVIIPEELAAVASSIDASSDGAIPEILVVGRRSGNTDIQRREDDVQPYRVLTTTDIAEAQAGSTDEFLRNRVASNQVVASAVQQPFAAGKVGSTIDLRGLGSAQTLVLIDGRRVASLPTDEAFLQSDVTGLPLAAIERVETYSGTAGGLYGPGSIGGVVNLVLKQNLPRLWIEGQTGIDNKGDGLQGRITGGFSLSTGDDRTHVTVLASYSRDQGLDFGQRDFVGAGRRLLDPFQLPLAQNINIVSADGEPLRLIPALGGRLLNSKITNVPINSGGAGGNEAALLLANAGSWDYRFSTDGNGAEQKLLVPFETAALIANARQKIGSQIELFADFLMMTDRGSSITPAADAILRTFEPGEAGNPFQNTITVSIPTPGVSDTAHARLTTTRTTFGVTIHLSDGWSMEGDAGFGAATDTEFVELKGADLENVDVFSPGTQLASALAQLPPAQTYIARLSNRLHDFNIRVAGRLFQLPGGPATVTISGERREEFSPNLQQTPPITIDNEHEQSVSSILGEARLPLIAPSSQLVPLRELELQLAVRADQYRIGIAPNSLFTDGSSLGASENHGTTLALTVGAKVSPFAGFILRGSFATGFQPPTALDLGPLNVNLSNVDDPKRPGDVAHEVSVITGGSPTLQPELAETLSVGFIAQPKLFPRLRFSMDYSRILTRREITDFSNNTDFFLVHEADYSDRIIRAPLTPDDRAHGYTGGAIELIDTGAINSGRSLYEVIDVDLSYERAVPLGRIGAYASVSWVLGYNRQTDPFDPPLQYAGRYNGPLRLKGIAGLSWHRGALGATIDTQYLGSYSTAAPGEAANLEPTLADGRIASNVPAQAYVDVGLTNALKIGSAKTVLFRLGIKNILNHTPPFALAPAPNFENAPGYSTYGDPRGRRYVLTVTAGL